MTLSAKRQEVIMSEPTPQTLEYYQSLDYDVIVEANGDEVRLCIPALGRLSCRAVGKDLPEAMENLKFVTETVIKHCLKNNIDIPIPHER